MHLTLLLAVLPLCTALLGCHGIQASGKQPPPKDKSDLLKNWGEDAIDQHLNHASNYGAEALWAQKDNDVQQSLANAEKHIGVAAAISALSRGHLQQDKLGPSKSRQ